MWRRLTDNNLFASVGKNIAAIKRDGKQLEVLSS